LLLIAKQELHADLRVKVSPSDLVQETFAAAQPGLASFQGATPEEFIAWLRGILANKLAQVRRRYLATASRDLKREATASNESSMQHLVDLVCDGETASRLLIRDEQRQSVQQAMERLPAHYRQVIQLRNLDLMAFEDVALVMHRPAGQVRALWVRAVKRLTRELHGHELH
jgi:RNA polymerase sigma-70 factor (ECF subfamily)